MIFYLLDKIIIGLIEILFVDGISGKLLLIMLIEGFE